MTNKFFYFLKKSIWAQFGFLLIGVAILLIVGPTSGRSKFVLHKPIRSESIKRFEYDYSDKIESAKQFAEIFINSYRNVIRKYANHRFLDSFYLANTDLISTKLYISNLEEIYLSFDPAGKPEFIVEATNFPIQYVLLYGLDFLSPTHKGNFLPDFLEHYNRAGSLIGVKKNTALILVNSSFSNHVRIFKFLGDSSVILLSSVHLIGYSVDTASYFKISHDTFVEGFGFLTNFRDWTNVMNKAAILGDSIAKFTIEQRFMESAFFRKVMAHDSLYPLAYKIQKKLSDKVNNHEYAFVDFQQDYNRLKELCKKYYLDDKFPEDLLSEANSTLTPGTLLFHYSDYLEFAYIWSILNLVSILFLPALRYVIARVAYLNILLRKYAPHALVVGLNAWIFANRPNGLSLIYWIIPGILFLIALWLSTRLFQESQTERNENDE